MRLPVEIRPRLPGRPALTFILPVVLAAGGLAGWAGAAMASSPSAPAGHETGPGADYPVLIGDAYSVAGVTYKPEDVLNYDTVGYVAADNGGSSAVTGAHHTLPLPSYVEVTSLESGRTILVRLERRGPMSSAHLLALSPGALAQLGSAAGTAVRVRRVNPPEDQRSLLRQGQPAPLRMDTPMSLVSVLKRKLPSPPAAGQGAATARSAPVSPATSPARPASAVATPPPLPPLIRPPVHAQVPDTSARPVAAGAQDAGFVVQAGAFSSADTARRIARSVGGSVSAAGSLWRVRTGPFTTRAAAEASLAKVRAAGYSSARIFTSG